MNYWRQGSHVPVLGAEGNKDRKKQGKKGKLSFGTIQIRKDGIKDFFK